MKTTGILFQSDMVLAILQGRKTLTSRLIVPQPEEIGFGRNCDVKPYCTGTDWPLLWLCELSDMETKPSRKWRCPVDGMGKTASEAVTKAAENAERRAA